MKSLVILLSSFPAFAQQPLDPAQILKPLADQWTT